MEKVYIAVKVTSQSDYTEGRYWSSAEDATDILAVFSTEKEAETFIASLPPWEETEEDDEGGNFYEYKIVEASIGVPLPCIGL